MQTRRGKGSGTDTKEGHDLGKARQRLRQVRLHAAKRRRQRHARQITRGQRSVSLPCHLLLTPWTLLHSSFHSPLHSSSTELQVSQPTPRAHYCLRTLTPPGEPGAPHVQRGLSLGPTRLINNKILASLVPTHAKRVFHLRPMLDARRAGTERGGVTHYERTSRPVTRSEQSAMCFPPIHSAQVPTTLPASTSLLPSSLPPSLSLTPSH